MPGYTGGMEALPLAVVRAHFDYNAWATRRLLAAAAGLDPADWERDFGTADKSVLGTLSHIYWAEKIWLARLEGRPVSKQPLPESERTREALESNWQVLHGAWSRYVAMLDAAGLERAVAYQDMSGHDWNQPVWQILLHVVNHSTHHRGQVSGFLRALGRVPPPLDLIRFYRESST